MKGKIDRTSKKPQNVMTIFVAKLDFAPNDVIAKKVRRRGARGRRHWTRKKIGCCVS